MNKQDQIRSRVVDEANHMVYARSTVRRVAEEFRISKSTVYNDFKERLPKIDWLLNQHVRAILNKNKAERHIRGGEATRKKYKK